MRSGIVCLGMLVLLTASPAIGQETLLGNFDGAFCVEPGMSCNAGSGFIGLVGWALASTPIRRVVLQVDGEDFGQVFYGQPRPDVTALFPGFPNSANPGWSYNLNSTLFLNGEHEVSVRVETTGGSSFTLQGEDLLFTNTPHLLEPFGEIDSPRQNEDVFGTCSSFVVGDDICEIGLGENCLNSSDCNENININDPLGQFCCGLDADPNPIGCNDPADRCNASGNTCSDESQIRYTVVRGWALDLGITQEDTGISWVELETNGALVGNTRTSCIFDPNQGGLTNCYGLPRLDLEGSYPFAFNAPSAGYRFALDVGGLITSGLVERGSNILTVRAGDISNQFEDIDDVPVNFLCAEEVSEPSFGRIESPREGRIYSGNLTFEGWALDGEGVFGVRIFVDGSLISGTLYGPGLGTRPLVAAEYPGFQDTSAPVWRLANFDTNQLTNGTHTLQVQVVDDLGDAVFIGGEVTFRVLNATALAFQ
ncbi:MAG: Ig-like domain-containing protein [Acidobacteriota bacterium]